jgi:hypothetical protein
MGLGDLAQALAPGAVLKDSYPVDVEWPPADMPPFQPGAAHTGSVCSTKVRQSPSPRTSRSARTRCRRQHVRSSPSVRTTPASRLLRVWLVPFPSTSTTTTSTSLSGSSANYSVNRRPRDDAELRSAAGDTIPSSSDDLKRLKKKIETYRKRAKRATVANSGKARYQIRAERWKQFVAWCR